MKNLLIITTLLFLTNCSISSLQATDNALCLGLEEPINELSDALISRQEKTPDEVIIKGSVVIKGFDSVC